MAKPLVFQWGDADLAFQLVKIDRRKLYGYKDLEVLDEAGGPCELATLADDGRTVIGRGGTGLGYVDADGLWVDKAALRPVDLEGEEIQPVASSFAAPIKLFETSTPDEYLNHNIRLLYVLESEEVPEDLRLELARGTIFSFPYSYRGGLEADAGFLLMGDGEELFLAVGSPTRTEFLGFQQVAEYHADEEDADETDLMDFDMI